MPSARKPGKTVIVSQHYAPDATTTAAYLTAIAEELAAGKQILVLSGSANSRSRSQDANPRVIEIDSWAPERKDALVRRSLAVVLFAARMFVATIRHTTENDVVMCVTTPFTLPYGVTLAAKLRGAATVLLIYDLYPEALEMAGLTRRGSPLARAIRLANGLMFRALDAIITIGRDVEPLLTTYKGVDPCKIRFIANWALLPIGYREPSLENPYRREFGDRLIVALSGNLGFTHSATTVYEAARLLKDDSDIHLLLSGWGGGWKQLQQLQADSQLGNVTLMDPVSESDLERFLTAADVWIIPYRRNVAGVSVPSRLYNLLAVGRAIIVAAETRSEAALVVQEENIGWVVRPEDPRALAEAIRAAASNRDETARMGRRAAAAALGYTRSVAIETYRGVFERISNQRGQVTK
jgi:colanic acid biosynthesis glycosyl transferase WcaI